MDFQNNKRPTWYKKKNFNVRIEKIKPLRMVRQGDILLGQAAIF